MGTKRAIARTVAACVEKSRPGPLLDAFSGMCSVGTAAGTHRPVWSNDYQLFAASVAQSFFCSTELPPSSAEAAVLLHETINTHAAELSDRFGDLLRIEDRCLKSCSANDFIECELVMQDYGHSFLNEGCFSSLSLTHHYPYILFSALYAGSYLGLKQCIDIDSIRFALDHARRLNLLSDQKHEWMVLALARAISKCATSTGHFAQPLAPKDSNVGRYSRQRSRSIYREWLASLDELMPIGSIDWRRGNRAFRGEAVALLRSMGAIGGPAVVYADPPYTNDQYSRYYHLYETLVLYDYPSATGKGRYRSGRAVSSFSLKAGVNTAMLNLIESVAAIGADIVLSYPTNGLLTQSCDAIPDMLSMHFKKVDNPILVDHVHSTMGGSKGEAQNSVTEVIYRAAA